MLKSAKGKIASVLMIAALFALTVVANASAALKIEAKDFTEPAETQLGEALPIVVGFVATVFIVGYIIRWIMRRANAAK